MSVDVLDVGSGNIHSVSNWISASGIRCRIVNDPRDLRSEVLVLPGVGSIGPYISRLRSQMFETPIIDHVNRGGTLVGICLGFQIMMEFSEEDGGIYGLGLLNGIVERLPNNYSHNAWESLMIKRHDLKEAGAIQKYKLTKKRNFCGRVFFNHEYGVINRERKGLAVPISDSLNSYAGLLVKDNIIGMQFHPEKSQSSGTELLKFIL